MGKELLLEDIAISDTVIQYDLGRRYADGFREKDTLEESLGQPDKNVRNLIAVLRTDFELERLEGKVSSYLRNMQSWTPEKEYQWRSKATYQYPGKGKTMLLCDIIDQLRQSELSENLYYFFCQATDSRLNNASSILRGLSQIAILDILCQERIRYIRKNNI
ncbi:hypothetical protein HDV63DRAFT_383771 [Trichoderma sp. SZMC 28014]